MPTLRVRRLAATGLVVAVGVVAAATPASVAAATTIVVNTLADTANATDGFCSLREAIVAASSETPSGGVSGECAAGTGTDLIAFSVGGTIHLSQGMNILAPVTRATIDGGNVITIDGGDAFVPMGVAGTVELRHLVIQNGSSANGGAVVGLGGDLTLTDVAIRSSSAPGAGGGIWASATNVTLNRVEVSGNTAATAGGGIYLEKGTLSMTASRVTGNTISSSAPSDRGGGIALVTATGLIDGSTIDHNHADIGGGVWADKGSAVTLTRSTLASNTSSDGAGLYGNDSASHYAIRTTTFSGNQASGYGGAIFGYWDWMDVRTSTFNGNTAAFGGGAVVQVSANATSFVNATFAGNSTSGGGGGAVSLGGGSLVLLHTTVTGNSSPGGSGALDASQAGTSIILRNSIVAGNPGGNIVGGVTTAADDVISTSASGILDPGGLKDNGGPTKTVKPLKTATAVIGKGSSGDGCGNANLDGKDQRGVTRPTTGCDIGAVQLESGKPTASAPKSAPAVGAVMGSSVPVRVTASWSDPGGSGVARFVLQKSVNGGSWSTVTSTMPASGITLKLSTGSSYRFRVKPVDYDGNVGVYTSAATAGTPAIRQQSSATFSGSWTTSSSTSFSGGSAKKSSSAGASAKYTFTGRAIGFVTTLGPARGKVQVYLDGTLKATVDLYAASTKYKVVAWSTRFSSSSSHTIKLVVVGTPSRPRIDVDAFTVLK